MLVRQPTLSRGFVDANSGMNQLVTLNMHCRVKPQPQRLPSQGQGGEVIWASLAQCLGATAMKRAAQDSTSLLGSCSKLPGGAQAALLLPQTQSASQQ